ncbi:hypothetical protein D3C81_1181760 [compost metagenome]
MASTPTTLLRLAAAAGLRPGSTPMIGTGSFLRSTSTAWPVAVLQAITSALQPWPSSHSHACSVRASTNVSGFSP